MCLRLREEGDADGAVVASEGSSQYVLTPMGQSLWHDSVQAAFGSLEAARGLELYWTLQAPQEGQAAAWLQNPIQMA